MAKAHQELRVHRSEVPERTQEQLRTFAGTQRKLLLPQHAARLIRQPEPFRTLLLELQGVLGLPVTLDNSGKPL